MKFCQSIVMVALFSTNLSFAMSPQAEQPEKVFDPVAMQRNLRQAYDAELNELAQDLAARIAQVPAQVESRLKNKVSMIYAIARDYPSLAPELDEYKKALALEYAILKKDFAVRLVLVSDPEFKNFINDPIAMEQLNNALIAYGINPEVPVEKYELFQEAQELTNMAREMLYSALGQQNLIINKRSHHYDQSKFTDPRLAELFK